jgi:hypothetical protein
VLPAGPSLPQLTTCKAAAARLCEQLMVGTTTKVLNHEQYENHKLQALSDSQLDMVARSNRGYQTLANVDDEEDPLVATNDDIPDIPLKGI